MELEELAELKTNLFSYRNGEKTAKDAFIEGAQIQENEDYERAFYIFYYFQDESELKNYDSTPDYYKALRKKFDNMWAKTKDTYNLLDYTNVESVLNIVSKTIGIEIDPEAYKRYNNDDKNVGSKR